MARRPAGRGAPEAEVKDGGNGRLNNHEVKGNAHKGGRTYARKVAALKKVNAKVRHKWKASETAEHMQYIQTALAGPHTEARVVQATLYEFNVRRVGPDGQARNPVNEKRVHVLMRRVLDTWSKSLKRKDARAIRRLQARAYNYALQAVDMASNGKMVTIRNGVPEGQTPPVVTVKPTVHGLVAALQHLADITGTNAPTKLEVTDGEQVDEPQTIAELIGEMSDIEIRRNMAEASARYPHMFPDHVEAKTSTTVAQKLGLA